MIHQQLKPRNADSGGIYMDCATIHTCVASLAAGCIRLVCSSTGICNQFACRSAHDSFRLHSQLTTKNSASLDATPSDDGQRAWVEMPTRRGRALAQPSVGVHRPAFRSSPSPALFKVHLLTDCARL